MLTTYTGENAVARLRLRAENPPKDLDTALDKMCDLWNDNRRFRQFLRDQHFPGEMGRTGYAPSLSHSFLIEIKAKGRQVKFDLTIEAKKGSFLRSFLEDLRHALILAAKDLAKNPRKQAEAVFFQHWRQVRR